MWRHGLDKLLATLANHKPKKYWARRFVKRSAVCMILRQAGSDTEILMIRRAERKGDPWSGHMAFPGGRFEDGIDGNLHQTATRETWEEIGLDCGEYTEQIARLSDVLTPTHIRRPSMVITPFIHQLTAEPQLELNHEVDEVVWIPLSFFLDAENRTTMEWKLGGMSLTLPCYFYEQRRVWGLSLKMLDELLQLCAEVKFK
jgi:8-oxo-dGTP pyrophosphatase MutT (NUDIX family)